MSNLHLMTFAGRKRARLRLVLYAALLVGAFTTGWSCSEEDYSSDVPEFVDCSVFEDQDSSPYVLPYAAGERFQVSRTFSHHDLRNSGVGLYAIDFLMPIGTTVHAARGGIVVAVEDQYSDEDRAEYHENWVMVQHVDGTVARYMHLTKDGAKVSVGDEITQGQVVGLSGNSGPSFAPHLHFDVQTCGPNLPPRYNRLPCGMTIPISFRNATTHTCGLEPREAYKAGRFTPDP